MLTATKTAPLLMTIVDLASKEINQADSREIGFPIRDYKTVRILSRGELPNKAITNLEKQNPGYCCVGITNYPYISDSEAPF